MLKWLTMTMIENANVIANMEESERVKLLKQTIPATSGRTTFSKGKCVNLYCIL
jgi:hypothetical protein